MWCWKSAYSKCGKHCMLVSFGRLGHCVMACWSHVSRWISVCLGQCAKWRWADILWSLMPGWNMTQLRRAQRCLSIVTSYLQWQMANPCYNVSMLQCIDATMYQCYNENSVREKMHNHKENPVGGRWEGRQYALGDNSLKQHQKMMWESSSCKCCEPKMPHAYF